MNLGLEQLCPLPVVPAWNLSIWYCLNKDGLCMERKFGNDLEDSHSIDPLRRQLKV